MTDKQKQREIVSIKKKQRALSDRLEELEKQDVAIVPRAGSFISTPRGIAYVDADNDNFLFSYGNIAKIYGPAANLRNKIGYSDALYESEPWEYCLVLTKKQFADKMMTVPCTARPVDNGLNCNEAIFLFSPFSPRETRVNDLWNHFMEEQQ